VYRREPRVFWVSYEVGRQVRVCGSEGSTELLATVSLGSVPASTRNSILFAEPPSPVRVCGSQRSTAFADVLTDVQESVGAAHDATLLLNAQRYAVEAGSR
jgi:hypothetical protein